MTNTKVSPSWDGKEKTENLGDLGLFVRIVKDEAFTCLRIWAFAFLRFYEGRD